MNKKRLYILPMILGSLSLSSCVDFVDGINDNPNNVTVTDVDAGLYLNTPSDPGLYKPTPINSK
jgi:hypothetical protein